MQYTVKQLKQLCEEQIKLGNGDKHIVLAGDNEGNTFHGMFYGFTPFEGEEYSEEIIDSQFTNGKDTIILG